MVLHPILRGHGSRRKRAAWLHRVSAYEGLESRTLLSVNVTTFHDDLTRQGLNSNETVLTPTNVNSANFGKLFSYPVTGQVYSQPLYVSNVTIPGQGTHNIIIVTTENNDVYALDANGNTGANQGVLWHVNFGLAAVTPNAFFGNRYGPFLDITPQVGITGTPVIDLATSTIYVNSFTQDIAGQDSYSHHIHALDLKTGQDKVTPMLVAASIPANGYGSVNGVMTFVAEKENQRSALTLLNGTLYVPYAAYADTDPYHGWLFGFNPTTLQLVSVFNSTPGVSTDTNQGEGGIWQAGGGPSSDGTNLFLETGNGDYGPTVGNYSDSVLKISTNSTTQASPGVNGYGLGVTDYFTPFNEQALADADADLGSASTILLPDQTGAIPHLLVASGKQGNIYLINRDNLGQHTTTVDNVVQTVAIGHGVYGTPTYFNSAVYYHAVGDVLKKYSLSGGLLSTAPSAQGAVTYATWAASPSASSNGNINGIIWDVQWNATTQVMHAYDATTLTELYNTSQIATRDKLGTGVKFITPTVADGQVFVGSGGSLTVYGLIVPPTAPPTAPTNLVGTATTATTVQLTWVRNSITETGFKIERSGDNVNFTQIAVAGAGTTTYTDSSVSPNTQYYYRVRATNSVGDSAYTNVVSVTTPSATNAAYWYQFNEGAGTTTADSAATNTGTLTGSPLPTWVTPGKNGAAAISFSGDGVYNQATVESAITVSQDLSPVLGSTSTLTAWIKTTQVGSQLHYQAPAITGVEVTASTNDIDWGTLDATGRIGVYVGDGGGVFSTNPINDGQWHHIAMTRDATTGVIQIFVDGVLNGTGRSDTGAKTASFSQLGVLTVLANDGVTRTGGNYFNGQLDDVRIYNQTLSAGEVSLLALAPVAPVLNSLTLNPGPVIHLAFTNPTSYSQSIQVYRKAGINGTYSLLATLPPSVTTYDDSAVVTGTTYTYQLQATNLAGSSPVSNELSATPPAPTVIGNFLFYNGSGYDGQNGSSNLTDNLAIATDKTPLLPGQTASFQNYSTYSKGLNGIIIDVANLDVLPRPDDFEFFVGNDNNPSGWTVAPLETYINSYPGRGPGGSTQITIIWPDNAIQNQWLKVRMLAQPHLGLLADNVFYFGNSIGDTGDTAANAFVTANDVTRVNNNFTASAGITNLYDINRDKVVDATDASIVSAHQTSAGTALNLITLPGSVPTVATAASASPSPTSGVSTTLSVLGADPLGEAGLTYSWSTSGIPPAAVSYSVNGTNASKSTLATFSKSGTYSFVVTITNSAGFFTTSSVNVVVNQTATSVSVLPSATRTGVNTSTTLSAMQLDQFSQAMTSQPTFTWSVSSGGGRVNASGVFTADPTAGTSVVRATATGGMFGSGSVTAFVEAVAYYPADSVAGATTLVDSTTNNFTAPLTTTYTYTTGVSGNALSLTGGYATLPTGIVSSLNDFTIATWVRMTTLANWARIFDFGTGAAVNMFLTPDAGGTNAIRYAITATGNGAEQRLDGPAMTANAWTHITVTLSGDVGTLYVNGVSVATNNAMTIHPTNMGTSTLNYLGKSQYADPALQGRIDDFRIYSRALSAQEVLRLATPTVVTAAVAVPTPVSGTTTNLSVTSTDITAGEAALAYTWSTTGIPPAAVTFSANGTNASKNTTATFAAAGTYTLQVSISNPTAGTTTTSSVNVTVNQTPAGFSISPASVTVDVGSSTQFTAGEVDQFGNPLASPFPITWSMVSGSGSINTYGYFTAPNTSGTTVIHALSSDGQNGNATITVTTPLAWYQANSSSGTTLTDSSGSGLNGTMNATANTSWVSGVSGNALSVAPAAGALTNGYVSLPTGIVNGLTDFTVASWVKVSTLAQWARVFDFGTGTNVYMFFAPLSGSGKPRFAITTTGGGGEQVINSPNSFALNTWTHIAVTLQGTVATMYWNGVAIATNTTMTLHPSNLGNTNRNYLGRSQFNADPYLTGTIDDFRLYNRALTATQVLALASPLVVAPVAGAPSPVVGTTTVLTLQGADQTAGEPALTYTWTTTGTPPAPVTFSSNGANASKTTTATFTQPGTYAFQVSLVNPAAGVTTTSTVNVTVNQTLTSIIVTPTGTSVMSGTTQQMTATAYDQFGGVITSPGTVTWNSTGVGNSASTTGLFTAGGTTGSSTVSATIGSVSGNTSVSVIPWQTTITSTGDSGTGTLRAALLAANTVPGVSHTLVFNLPTGPQSIVISSALPATTDPVIASLGNTQDVTIGSGSGLAWDNFTNLTKTGAGALTLGGSQNHTAADSITVSAGSLKLTSDAGTNTSLSAAAPVTFTSSQHLASLAINGTTISVPGSDKLLAVSSLAIDTTGKIDLAGNKMIVHATGGTLASVLGNVTGWLMTGFGAGPTHWNGSGINSSTALNDTNHITAVGMMSNAFFSGQRVSTFAGESVSASDILIRYTYYGDANLDGTLNGGDYAITDNGFNFGLPGFGNGDFNYDGLINASDYALLDNAYNLQGGPLNGSALQPLTLSLPLALVTVTGANSAAAQDLALAAYVNSQSFNVNDALLDVLATSTKKKGTI